MKLNHLKIGKSHGRSRTKRHDVIQVAKPIVASLMLAFSACLFLRLGVALYGGLSTRHALFIAYSQALDQHFLMIWLTVSTAVFLLLTAWMMIRDLFLLPFPPNAHGNDHQDKTHNRPKHWPVKSRWITPLKDFQQRGDCKNE